MPLDTIAAVATPFGEGAIAMLRISGAQACEIAGRVCRVHAPDGAERPLAGLQPRRSYRARLLSANGETLDDVLVSVHFAPASYTGEHLVEITCHGGVLVTHRALDALLAAGALPAQPGEFTQRAFLNGKMDLTQAEAVMDLISAQTDLALRAAHEQLAGHLGARVNGLRESLLSLVAHVEAYIDFPDEDIDPETGAALVGRCDEILAVLDALLATAGQGRILREGVRTVIYGEPNVGKSSLLNALAGHERAIVSAIPGTTRDTIEEFINLRGLPLRLIDTAGLRDSTDPIENAGMARTRESLSRADLAIALADASQPPAICGPIAALPGDAVSILVLNKVDLGVDAGWSAPEYEAALRISCRTGEGLDALADTVFQRVTGGQIAWNPATAAINARHGRCLTRAHESLVAGRSAMATGTSPEFVALDLRAALDAVGEIVGGVDTEEILGKIFATFCIGK